MRPTVATGRRRSDYNRRQASIDNPRYPPQTASPSHRPSLSQSQLQVSDYESDNPAYLSDIPFPPPPVQNRTNQELNLEVLRRHNHDIASILSIAPYAVIYEFSPHPTPSWSKTGVEGSLFICQLTPGSQLGEDRYTAIVLNRRGLNNFEAELRDGEKSGIEITDEYVIVSVEESGVNKIYGIFIFSEGPRTSTEKTRTTNAEKMRECAVQAKLSLEAAEAKAAEALPPERNGHPRDQASLRDELGKGVSMDRQMSLQEHLGMQRAEDASWSVRVHSPEAPEPPGQQSFSAPRQAQSEARSGPPQPHNALLLNLFREAGKQPQQQLVFAGSRQAQAGPQPTPFPQVQQQGSDGSRATYVGGLPPSPPQVQQQQHHPQQDLFDLFRRAGLAPRS